LFCESLILEKTTLSMIRHLKRWSQASSRMSQSRPGVATSTSTPRSSIRRCFCADIPPTTAAMLTRGGALFDLVSCCFSLPLVSSRSTSCSCLLTSMIRAKILRWSETCKASSRVGANISAWSFRLVLGGRGCDRMCWRMGSPYASVFPDP
jgi:hypothetical protein